MSRSTRQRKATGREDRRPPQLGDDAPVVPPSAPASASASSSASRRSATPRLATDDLLAIASMDPAELAALMEGAMRSDAMETGTEVSGFVTTVGEQAVLVDIGGKAEAWMERSELPDAKVGDAVKAYVIHAGEDSVRISRQLTGDAASLHLEDAKESGVPVEGKVVSANPGGFEVRIGDVRAFCPRSLMSRQYVEAPEVFVGQTLSFKVIETGDKIVLSRRAIEEARAEIFAADFWTRVVVDMQLDGIVRSIQPFGVFVDLGGVDGLIPKRELSWSDDGAPGDHVALGETVTVRVLEVDHANRKLVLTLKDPDQAPWHRVGSEFVEGGLYEAKVARITPFGVFVRLAEGLDGLIHTSKLAAGVPKQGDAITVRVLAIDGDRRRISLAPVSADAAAEAAASEPEQVSGTVAEVMRNGVVVQLADGRTGWLPAAEVELPAGTLLPQRFRRGKAITARVLDGSRPDRLTLTLRAAEADDWRQHAAAAAKKPAASSFGTFGDLFAGLKLPQK
jgi:small subunit ribosomal protein S1